MQSIEQALDASQLKFAKDPGNALRLLAPAGSGKTHSILWRCLYQFEHAETSSPRFLIVTFTRVARDELRHRLDTTPEFETIRNHVEAVTLNQWGFRRLKSRSKHPRLLTSKQDYYFALANNLQRIWEHHPAVEAVASKRGGDYHKNIFEVMDGLKSLCLRHDQEGPFDVDTFREDLSNSGLLNYFDALVERLVNLKICQDPGWAGYGDFTTNFLGFYREAVAELYRSSFFTLEDQKYWTWLRLQEDLEEGKFTTGRNRFSHVMVDEFQDINLLDLNLLKTIAALNKTELTIIGDDDQAIFEWRGGSPKFVVYPERFLPGDYTTYILEKNYRSPANIVSMSQRLIRQNKIRVEKDVKAHSKKKAEVLVRRYASTHDCIQYVIDTTKKLISENPDKKIALIGRKQGQILPFQILFASDQQPFYAAEDLIVFLSTAFDEVTQTLGYWIRRDMRKMPGLPFDPVEDCLNLCDAVGRWKLSKSDKSELRGYLVRQMPKTLRDAASSIGNYTGRLKKANDRGRMSEKFSEALLRFLNAETIAEAIMAISSNFEGYRKDYGKSLEDVFYKDPPFLHLAEFARKYGDDYESFLQDLEQAKAALEPYRADNEDGGRRNECLDAPVHLMTALRAKGKEFDTVILLDVNDGVWPGALAEGEEQLEQERRLFYVACTRARDRLILVVNDGLFGTGASPSPYIQELGLPLP